MDLQALFQWLYDSPVGTAVRESGSLFPWIESVHVLSITLVVGSISIVDLRLLGLTSKSRAVSRLTGEVLPFTWTAFILAAITGGLLFSSNAVKYSHNSFFLAKMALLVVAFLNMVVFHVITSRGIEHWDESPHPPLRARLAGGLSLLLWIAVITCGRWIGFTMSAF
ncbi:MAG TPA: DUF6644 family protein [Caulobacteraceae bacterium]